MAVPFGFSVGDVIAAINLISDIISALRSADGAVANFRDLMTDLKGFEQALISIQAREPEPSSPVYPAVTRAVDNCRQSISRFLTKVSKYQSLSAGGSSLRDQILKVKWSTCRQKDVENLRQSLTISTSILQFSLTEIGNATAARSEEKLNELRNWLRRTGMNSRICCKRSGICYRIPTCQAELVK